MASQRWSGRTEQFTRRVVWDRVWIAYTALFCQNCLSFLLPHKVHNKREWAGTCTVKLQRCLELTKWIDSLQHASNFCNGFVPVLQSFTVMLSDLIRFVPLNRNRHRELQRLLNAYKSFTFEHQEEICSCCQQLFLSTRLIRTWREGVTIVKTNYHKRPHVYWQPNSKTK